jgi:exosome complex RNA-binding protein Csl4
MGAKTLPEDVLARFEESLKAEKEKHCVSSEISATASARARRTAAAISRRLPCTRPIRVPTPT